MSCVDLTSDDELAEQLPAQRLRDKAEHFLPLLQERANSFHQPPQFVMDVLMHCQGIARWTSEILKNNREIPEESQVDECSRELQELAMCALGSSMDALGAGPQNLLGTKLFIRVDESVSGLKALGVPHSKFVAGCEKRPEPIVNSEMFLVPSGNIVIHFKDATGTLCGSGVILASKPPVFRTNCDGRLEIERNPVFPQTASGTVAFKCRHAHFNREGEVSTPVGNYLISHGVGQKTDVWNVARSYTIPRNWDAQRCGQCQALKLHQENNCASAAPAAVSDLGSTTYCSKS